MLSTTFNQYRHDAERRISEKDEEIECIRWVFFFAFFTTFFKKRAFSEVNCVIYAFYMLEVDYF